MGMKWREGQLQIKGLESSLGTQVFRAHEGHHAGRVERWMKWSYEGKSIESAFSPWFSSSQSGPKIVEVQKTRCLRKMSINPFSGALTEVDASAPIDRGGILEVTDLRVRERSYCSIAFEAFPNDSAMHGNFTTFVNTFLETLPVDSRCRSASVARSDLDFSGRYRPSLVPSKVSLIVGLGYAEGTCEGQLRDVVLIERTNVLIVGLLGLSLRIGDCKVVGDSSTKALLRFGESLIGKIDIGIIVCRGVSHRLRKMSWKWEDSRILGSSLIQVVWVKYECIRIIMFEH